MESAQSIWRKNYATVCRLCLERDGYMLAIFNVNNRNLQVNLNVENDEISNRAEDVTPKNSIHKKIKEFIQVEIDSNDGLPMNICHRCLYKVELCSEFKQQCLQSDATLRKINTDCFSDKNIPEVVSSFHNTGVPHDEYPTEESLMSKKIIENLQFEEFSLKNQSILQAGDVENVVMVVDPTMEYESDESEIEQEAEIEYEDTERHSDVENENIIDLQELKNVFMCQYCDRAFTDQDSCYEHEQTMHDADMPFVCRDCDMTFGDRVNHTAHLKSVHKNDKPFGCPECDRSFSRRSDLRKHTVVHTGIKPFTCNICFKSFSRNTNLTKHLRIHSGHKPYVCPQCPRTFISKGDLTRHALIHSGIKPFTCSQCDQCFGRRDKLIRHEKRHQRTMNLDPKQDLIFPRHHLLQNDQYDEIAKNIKQELNGENWDSSENMVINVDPFNHESQHNEMHIQELEHIEPHDDLPHIPEHIERELPRIPEHITGDSGFAGFPSIESGVKSFTPNRFACSLCPKKFESADNLRFHLGVHTGIRPHGCQLCSKTFIRKRELDRHMTTHTGMKPFKCNICDKRFGRKDKLVRHIRVHDSTRSFCCDICNATFFRKDGLVHHLKTHVKKDGLSLSTSGESLLNTVKDC